ncbi:MAG: hypothetical protein ABIR84_01965 [Candidatus Nitrotoga sp.]
MASLIAFHGQSPVCQAQPKLTDNSGNLALLMLAGELIKVELAEAASNSYRTLRELQHQMRLNYQSPCRIEKKTINTTSVVTLWEKFFGATLSRKKEHLLTIWRDSH